MPTRKCLIFECSVEPFSENEMIKEKGGRGSVLSCIKQKLIVNDGGTASEISSKTTGEKRLFRKNLFCTLFVKFKIVALVGFKVTV